MKTNQVLTRKMGTFDVLQRTSDGMFNATMLLQQWNNKNTHEQRDISNFWRATNLKELMLEIVENEVYPSSVKSTDDNKVQTISNLSDSDFEYLKGVLSRTSRASKGLNSGTWMHPVLFIKFAMYLSPRFEYHVLKFVSDELIHYRNDAGDSYRDMCSAVLRIVGEENKKDSLMQVAKALNYIVYNNHESEARNKNADESSMKDLVELQKKITQLINEDFISSFDELMLYLRKLWRRKYQPNCFSIGSVEQLKK